MSRLAALFAPALLAVVAAGGCAMMMKGMTVTPKTADNPLVSGHPLEASKQARIGTTTEKDCSVWPFEDTMSVSVTDAEICISVRKHIEQSPGWTGEPTANSSDPYRVTNDVNEGGSITIKKVKASKVGKCFERGYNADIGVWAFEYHGCAPNNGTISKTTKSMNVGDESWSFPVTEPAAPAATQPATAAAAAP
ncbi:MAG: hypothetical protein ABI867_40330 [Kofleriaceae bacterium]